MLVLTRKVGEEICIGEFIKIRVTAINRNSVKIGLDVPKIFPIKRSELKNKLKKQLFNPQS